MRLTGYGLTGLAFVGSMWPGGAEAAKPDRKGLQIEGLIGVAVCLDGRSDCESDRGQLVGETKPSFATGVTLGFRPLKWLLVGGLYRWGMYDLDYDGGGADVYRTGGQHTLAFLVRPILPLWRFDLGVNVAPGYSRQVYWRSEGNRDFSHGFSFLTGPTVTVYVTKRLFLGAEADFVFATQRRACNVRGNDTRCFDVDDEITISATHQMLFGLVVGGTLL